MKGRRCYVRCSKAWYSQALRGKIEVIIGIYNSEGCEGEFNIVWEEIDKGKLTPQLQAFDGSWEALNKFKDLLDAMAKIDRKNVQESEFCKILDSLGIKDITEYEYTNKNKFKFVF